MRAKGEAKDNAKVLESAVKDMETITGQKAVLTRAKNSVANFKIREGMAIGCKTTPVSYTHLTLPTSLVEGRYPYK